MRDSDNRAPGSFRPGQARTDAVHREYERMARCYDRRWAAYVAQTADATVAALAPSAGERILDIGCGTGAVLARLVDPIGPEQLTGVDPSAAMLEVARTALPARVALREGRAEALPGDDATFDACVSSNVFHFVPEPEAALHEMRRVLRPAGRIVITDWCHDYLSCRLLERWLRLTGRGHRRTYRATELHAMVAHAGFSAVTVQRYRVGWWWGMMTLTARRAD